MTTMTKAQPTTDLKGLIERARARRKWDSARGMERADTPIPYLEEELATALESILSRQPFEMDGCVVKMQLVPVSLHVDMIEAWSKLALERIKNPEANKGFEASMHETYRAILAASAASVSESGNVKGV